MANEFLTRTPTSSGNQKVFTYSCWIKRNKISDWMRLLSIMNGNTDAIIQLTNVNKLRFREEVTSPDIDYISSRPLRDVGSWMHLLIAIDTTAIQAEHRIRMYINGDSLIEHGLDTESMPGDKNLDLQFNDKLEHRFFARNNNSEYFFGEAFDLFWVDGQALTPDVFGFNKDGDGYVSVGSTQSTDFRPGQWSPKAPRTIKSEINRRGGFGVNGFYLPMNDSSNIGADFHCAPDSIITLKGEDLPQPRNGLPTTSDNYVSQLRSDPYAANVVLAVPGVNTQPTGSELVTNGTFDTNVSGWTVTDTGTIVRQSDGTAKVTRGSSAEVVYQNITTVVGTTYELSVDITDIAGSHGQVYVRSTYNGGSLNTNIGYSYYPGTFKGTFTADTTTTRITLYAHTSGSASYDNISVKATTIPDYHANIKGSGTNKTITAYADASVRNPHQRHGRHVNGYYGSALSLDGTGDVLKIASHADFNLGNGDYTIEGWYYDQETAINTGNRCYWAIGGVNSEGTLALFRENQYLMLRGRSPGDGTYTNIIYVTNHNIPVAQWNHICTERYNGVITVYLNGVAIQTNLSESTTVSQGYFTIGAFSSGGSYPYYGYIQDVRVYKGVAKYKGGFDVPKPYAPENGSTNYGIETWRQVPDNCKNNFATLSPLSYQTTGTYGSSVPVLSNGNLTYTHGQTSQWERSNSTMGVGEGKWYFEFEVVTRPVTGNSENWAVGVRESDSSLFYGETDGFEDLGDHVYWIDGGTAKIVSNQDRSAGSTSGITAVANGDIINIAFEKTATALKVWFGKNGTYFNSGNPATGSNPAVNHSTTSTFIIPAVAYYQYSGQEEPVATFNFGQNPTFSGTVTAGTYVDGNGKGLFKYAPPTGFLALCEDNLPTPAIADPGEHFKCVLYTGDGNSSRSITGVGFKPDLIWLKSRGSGNHGLYDSVRGPHKRLQSDSTAAEGTVVFPGASSDGFNFGSETYYNGSSTNYVAWCWKAGGAAVANTDGSINSSVSANQTAGFSIVSYTGTGSAGTVGHGLGKRPKVVIVKRRDAATNWPIFFDGISNNTNDLIQLNISNATATAGNFFNSGDTTTTTFPLGTGDGQTNQSGSGHIAYCWAEIEGYSKFGSYTGNANADGTFIYCGFKPAFVITKRTDGTSSWLIHDSSRDSVNPVMGALYTNSSDAEGRGSVRVDFVSNGFKHRNADGGAANNYANNYIFMAFAESPFQTANAK